MEERNDKDKKTVRLRIKKDKELIISQLKKTPIIQLACEKTGIGRATFYRWKTKDKSFSKRAEVAIQEGSLLVNDLAESQLLSSIADKNMTAIIFWLKHHHPSYETRVEIKQASSGMEEKLTKRQQEIVREALKLSQFELTSGNRDGKETN
jgi:ACT domain-containing protein